MLEHNRGNFRDWQLGTGQGAFPCNHRLTVPYHLDAAGQVLCSTENPDRRDSSQFARCGSGGYQKEVGLSTKLQTLWRAFLGQPDPAIDEMQSDIEFLKDRVDTLEETVSRIAEDF